MVVEDGTGVEGANSYVDMPYADAYHLARGNAWLEGEDALVRATDYIDREFSGLFLGDRKAFDQSLEWPRKHVPIGGYKYFGDDVIPDALKKAVCDVALAMVQGTTETATGGAIKAEKIDDVGEFQYFEPTEYETSGFCVDVADTLRRFLRPANRLVRV